MYDWKVGWEAGLKETLNSGVTERILQALVGMAKVKLCEEEVKGSFEESIEIGFRDEWNSITFTTCPE